MRWQVRQESDDVEDRRGQSSDLGAGGGFRGPVGGKDSIAILVVVLLRNRPFAAAQRRRWGSVQPAAKHQYQPERQ